MSGSRIVGALRTSVALRIKDKGRVNRMQILPTLGRLAWRREAEGEGTVFAELGSLCAGDCAFLSTPTGEWTDGGSRRRSACQEKTACLGRTTP